MREEHEKKKISDIYTQIKQLIADEDKSVEEAREIIREELLDYYSTPEGREEITKSPHKNLTTREAVDLLMMDIDIRSVHERRNKDKAVKHEQRNERNGGIIQ